MDHHWRMCDDYNGFVHSKCYIVRNDIVLFRVEMSFSSNSDFELYLFLEQFFTLEV